MASTKAEIIKRVREEFEKIISRLERADMTSGYLNNLSEVGLPCHGCGHSVGEGIFPNAPSGEWACIYCERNKRNAFVESDVKFLSHSSAPRSPRDYYVATDAIDHYRSWADTEAAKKWAPFKELYESLLNKDK